MNGGMAIGAPVVESFFEGTGIAACRMLQGGGHEPAVMAGMALHAEEGLRRREQRIVGGAVCPMAVGAVFRHIGVLKDERPLFLHMASGAGFLLGQSLQHFVLGRPVGIMAVRARHLAFGHGMVGKLGELHSDILMAFEAELRRLLIGNLLLRTLVKGVAVGTAHIAGGMSTGAPELQDGS